jgi:sphingomyelin phosphodiesterase 2
MAGSHLSARCKEIGRAMEASDAHVVCFQEALTYYHLRLLAERMPSFRHVLFKRTLAGPAGGVVTFSRLSADSVWYRRFPLSAPKGVTVRTAITSLLKGMLVTRLACGACVVNVHPVANTDGDWSPDNRYTRFQRRQLNAVACLTRDMARHYPVVACGDFNVSRDSGLWREFIAGSGLSDAFKGRCPPTFRAEYLPPSRVPQCIDFILASDRVTTTEARVILEGRHQLPRGPGYLSDHVGLSAHAEIVPP